MHYPRSVTFDHIAAARRIPIPPTETFILTKNFVPYAHEKSSSPNKSLRDHGYSPGVS